MVRENEESQRKPGAKYFRNIRKKINLKWKDVETVAVDRELWSTLVANVLNRGCDDGYRR